MPRAGDAFLLGALPLTHDPLARIDTQANKPPFDLEAILQQVELFVTDFLFPAIKNLTGIDLSFLGNIFEGVDLSNPGGILAAITTAVGTVGMALIQQVIDALVSGLTGSSSTGNDPISIALALINQGLQIPLGFLGQLAQLFGLQSTSQAQVDSLNSGGFNYDVAINGITGWTNLVGALAVSARGKFIQAATQTVAYRASGLSVDKFGVHAVLNPSMRGAARIGICSTSTGSNWAGLEVYRGFDGDAIRLITGASPTLTVVQKQADFIATQRLPDLTTVDVKTDGVNKFTVLCNGQPVTALDWTDSGGIVTHGASNRNVILTTNGFNRNEDSFYGPAFTKVVSYAA